MSDDPTTTPAEGTFRMPKPGEAATPEAVTVIQNEDWRPREGQPTEHAPDVKAPTYLPPNAKEPPKL